MDTTHWKYSPTGFCVSRLFPLYVSNKLRDAYLVLPSFPFAVCPERSDIALSAHWVWWALRLGVGGRRKEKKRGEWDLMQGSKASYIFFVCLCNKHQLRLQVNQQRFIKMLNNLWQHLSTFFIFFTTVTYNSTIPLILSAW